MSTPSSARPPLTRLTPPRVDTAPYLRAFILRDARGCDLRGDGLLNRFPASYHCALTWFLDGGATLLGDDGQAAAALPRCVLSGCQTRPFASLSRPGTRGFIAMFYPDAFHALFGLDLAPLQNRFVDVRAVLPASGLALVDAVGATHTDAQRQALVERFVLDATHGHTLPAWLRLRRMGSRLTLGMASAMLGIGPRQLQRLALREAGANLQTLMRLRRGERSFLGVQRRRRQDGPLDWSDHALASDYADQSHMARACKAQTGRTPTQLARDVRHAEADWIYRLEFPDDEDGPSARSA